MVITTNSRLHFQVTSEEAHRIDEVIGGSNPPTFIEIQGNTISVASINGIIEDSVWYKDHPKDRPTPKPELFKIAEPKKPLNESGEGYQHFQKMGAKLRRAYQ